MSCSQCGASVAADDPFCPKCGARQSAELPLPADPLRAALERALGAQYDIQRLLGRGGMGAVYLAREKALERAVAIKVLPSDVATDADSRERFRREARTAAKLTHPNIVPLLTFGDVEGMLYFVMGYVKGESLGERMRREGKLPEEDVRRILAEVADALHYAHKQGVVHRDIKPDNILLDDETGRPMLTDFGVAKARASGTTLTEVGAVVGTPYYMSPEQASGARDIDGRSDLYSLGVMGYQMLSGRLPFEGESFRDIVVQHVTQEPAPLAGFAPDTPPDLVAVVMRCLAKEPAKRWADAQELKDALRAGDDPAEYDPSAPGVEARSLLFSVATLEAGAAVLALLMLVFPGFRFFGDESWLLWPATLGLGAGLGIILVFVAGRHRGTPWPTLLRYALFPPRWWPFWWPRAWRRPHDVWCRFPPLLRRLRMLTLWGALSFFGLALITFLAMGLMGRHPELARKLKEIGMAAALPGIFGLCASWVITGRWGMARGLTANDAYLLVSVSSMQAAFWNRPKFAALLLPPAGRAKTTQGSEPRSPDEYAHAIRDLVAQLPSGTQATVSQAADAARQLLGTLAALDAELARLAQDADPQELEAIQVKLRALGAETPDEGDVRRQKRALLVPQRDLLLQLGRRMAEVTDRRTRLLDLLRTMWLQVATLRAEAAHDTLAVTEISGRVKTLCAEIDAHVQGAETVRLETS